MLDLKIFTNSHKGLIDNRIFAATRVRDLVLVEVDCRDEFAGRGRLRKV